MNDKKLAYEMVFAMLQQIFKDGVVYNTANYFRRYIECFWLGYTFRITLTIKREVEKNESDC